MKVKLQSRRGKVLTRSPPRLTVSAKVAEMSGRIYGARTTHWARRELSRLIVAAQRLLLKRNRRRIRTMTRRSRRVRGFPAATDDPTFAKRGAVADLDRDALATGIQFLPERIGSVERDRVLPVIVRSEHIQRLTRREYTTAHVGLRSGMISGSKNFLEHLGPILHRLIIHLHDDMLDDRWSNAFVGEGKANRPVAVIELQNRPDRSTHLLALHVSGVTGNAQRTESDKGRDDRVVSTSAARRLFLRHG